MKAEENNQAPESGTVIRAAAADRDAETAALRRSTDPIEIACAARSRIVAEMKFPTPERERAAAALLISRSKVLDELIYNGVDLNYLRRRVGELEEDCRRLSIPEKPPSFQDEMRRLVESFRGASWSQNEAHGLEAFFQSGDRISGITISSVMLGDRKILRSDVRKKLRGSVSSVQLDQFEKREAEALQLEAENADRQRRGLNTIHRQWE